MKNLIYACLISLTLGQVTLADPSGGRMEVYDEVNRRVTTEHLDSKNVLVRRPPQGPPPHARPAPPVGGTWRPHPQWRDGWRWNQPRPPRWAIGARFTWFWITVPATYWQCIAFNSSLQAFPQIGPDVNQAAYGALYDCGGPNFENLGPTFHRVTANLDKCSNEREKRGEKAALFLFFYV